MAGRSRCSSPWRPRLLTGGLAALLATALLLLFSAPTGAHFSSRKAIWGPGFTEQGSSLFPTYERLGIGIYEDRIEWSTAAPSRPRNPRDPNDPAYVWPSEVTRAVSEAQRYHMRVALQLFGSPPWANGGRSLKWAPLNPNDFADFAAAAARRYPSVHLWMIWGEPTRPAAFEPITRAPFYAKKLTPEQAVAPHTYARLLDAAYGALKGVSTQNMVIGGMTFTAGAIRTLQWIQNLVLPGGKRPRLDLYGHNPFSGRHPSLSNPSSPHGAVDFSDLGRLAAWVDRYLGNGKRHIDLFLSEWTIPTAPDGEFNFYVAPALQARWIDDAFSIIHSWPQIYALGWIHLVDGGLTAGGLEYANGQPKPGFFAFQRG